MATAEVQHVARTLADHLPVLQVLVPFVAAPLIVFLGNRALAWLTAGQQTRLVGKDAAGQPVHRLLGCLPGHMLPIQ